MWDQTHLHLFLVPLFWEHPHPRALPVTFVSERVKGYIGFWQAFALLNFRASLTLNPPPPPPQRELVSSPNFHISKVHNLRIG